MWLIWGMLIVGVPLMGLALYGLWNERQAEKYKEWKKQQEEQEKNGAPA
jgi:hypothetical protein